MHELRALVLGQFVVAACMGLAAVCLFVWAVATAAFGDVEAVKLQVLASEDDDQDG